MIETSEVQAVVVQGDVWRRFLAEHHERQSGEEGGTHFCAQSGKPACRFICAVLQLVASPVKVRREDYDALVAALDGDDVHRLRSRVGPAARALIGNAVVDESCELSWCDSPSMAGVRLCADHMGGSLRYEVPDHG